MPINEILAPFYVVITYATTAYPTGHKFRMYFDEVPTYESDETVFPSYTDAEHTEGWSLQSIIAEFFERWVAGLSNGAMTITSVEMWESAAGVNTFIGLDPDNYSGSIFGSGAGVASAYTMFVFKAGDKSQMRWVTFEANDSKPQRFPLVSPPLTDDGGLAWFVLRSAVKFVTNDNKRLVQGSSWNTGYNKGLAKSYGRRVSP